MPLPAIGIKTIFYYKKVQISFFFDFNNELKKLVKSIEGTSWS